MLTMEIINMIVTKDNSYMIAKMLIPNMIATMVKATYMIATMVNTHMIATMVAYQSMLCKQRKLTNGNQPVLSTIR